MPVLVPAPIGGGGGGYGAGGYGVGGYGVGSAVLIAAEATQAPLLCSDVDLVCSDLLSCADIGAVAAVSSTGTMVPA
jgi:hypothetical protein